MRCQLVDVIGIGILAAVALIAICTLWLTMSRPDDFGRRHRFLVLALGSITFVGSLALGLGSLLFLQTYKPEPYFGFFYVPVLTCLAALVVSSVGLIMGAVVLFRLWRAVRAQ
jgi:hypothetical protein